MLAKFSTDDEILTSLFDVSIACLDVFSGGVLCKIV